LNGAAWSERCGLPSSVNIQNCSLAIAGLVGRQELLTRTAEEYRDSASARAKLVNGLSRLRDHASELARSNATELVQRFGEMGRRKFNLAA
jgi:hypothetical protein